MAQKTGIYRQSSPPVKASTQSFVGIEDIKNDIVLLKDNSCVLIVETGAVNFMLLSQEEQESMIYAYANLINSLSFPVQILMLSKKSDISSYLEYLDDRISKQRNTLLKDKLVDYKTFVKNIVKKNIVLQKRFFMVIPFSPLELGPMGAGSKRFSKEYIISRAKISLYPKKDHLSRLLAKIGLKANTLQKQAIVELFYNLYNPTNTGRKLSPVESYLDTVLTTA